MKELTKNQFKHCKTISDVDTMKIIISHLMNRYLKSNHCYVDLFYHLKLMQDKYLPIMQQKKNLQKHNQIVLDYHCTLACSTGICNVNLARSDLLLSIANNFNCSQIEKFISMHKSAKVEEHIYNISVF